MPYITRVLHGASTICPMCYTGLNWELNALKSSNSLKYFINDHCDDLYKIIKDHHWTSLIPWNILSVMVIVISYIKWLCTIIKNLINNWELDALNRSNSLKYHFIIIWGGESHWNIAPYHNGVWRWSILYHELNEQPLSANRGIWIWLPTQLSPTFLAGFSKILRMIWNQK